MSVTVNQKINARRDRVWELITDIDRWTEMISGIETIEVIDRPQQGILSLKWREKRIFFGKEAWETMWISDASPGNWYETSAENHGAVYTTRVSLTGDGDSTVLTMSFSARATTFAARLMSLLAFMFNSTIRKALQQDLDDIRAAAEAA